MEIEPLGYSPVPKATLPPDAPREAVDSHSVNERVTLGESKRMHMLSPHAMKEFLKTDMVTWRIDPQDGGMNVTVTKDGTLYVTSERTLTRVDEKNGGARWKKTFEDYVHEYYPAEGPDGTLYITTIRRDDTGESFDAALRAFEPDSGKEKWSLPLRNPKVPVRVSQNGMIYVTADKKLHAIDPDGKVIGSYDCHDKFLALATAAHDGTAFVRTDRGIFGISPEGSEIWHVPGINSQYYPAQKDKVFTSGQKKIVARNVKTGEKLWDVDLKNEVGFISAATGDRIFTYTPEGISCIDSATGKESWSRSYGQNAHVKLISPRGTVIVGSENTLEELDLTTGNPRWSRVFPGNITWGETYTRADGTLLLHDDNRVYRIDLQDKGSTLFEFKAPEGVKGLYKNSTGNMIFIQNQKSAVLGIDCRTSEEKARDFAAEDAEPCGEGSPIEIEDDMVNIKGIRLRREA